jgi:hypothetical protein
MFPERKHGLLRFARNDVEMPSRFDTAAKISSPLSLTGYLPVSSRAHLPAFSMRLRKSLHALACIAHATPINSPAT